jgi:predicted metalloprotease with PDZ domain
MEVRDVRPSSANAGGADSDQPSRPISIPALGVDIAEAAGTVTIRAVPANSPGYDQGLNAGDQIVAIDGYRASAAFLTSYLGDKKSNDKVKLTVFRFDKLRDIPITLGADVRKEYRFSPVAQPTEEQKKLYHGYLNADL